MFSTGCGLLLGILVCLGVVQSIRLGSFGLDFIRTPLGLGIALANSISKS